MNFDLKKFLTENKITSNSKLLAENSELETESSGKFGDDTLLLSDPELKGKVDSVVDNPNTFSAVKADIEALIANSQIKSKDHMLNALKDINRPYNLLKWYYNSILAKGGLRSPDATKGLKETQEEEIVQEEAPDYSKYLALRSADEVIQEIETELTKTTLENKIARVKEVIEALEQKANSLEEDANLKGFVNTSKLKEMRRMTKKLRASQEKYVKEYESRYSDKKKK